MTRTLLGLVGLMIGVLLGIGLLMLNPMAWLEGKPVALAGAVRTLDWRAGGGFRGLELTPRGLLGGSGYDAAFEDPGIRYARAEIVVLTPEGGGPPALGIRLSAAARGNSLLRARLDVVTAWNIVWPGQGSVLASGSENFWAPLRTGLWSALRGRGFRPAPDIYPLPPLAQAGTPLVVTGTGGLVSARGPIREDMSPSEAAPADFTGQRRLEFATE